MDDALAATQKQLTEVQLELSIAEAEYELAVKKAVLQKELQNLQASLNPPFTSTPAHAPVKREPSGTRPIERDWYPPGSPRPCGDLHQTRVKQQGSVDQQQFSPVDFGLHSPTASGYSGRQGNAEQPRQVLYNPHRYNSDDRESQSSMALGSGRRQFQPNRPPPPPIDPSVFLAKRDLLAHRLTEFNDRPESFHVWKGSFLSVIEDLQLSPSEELDLLAKHLGPESKGYAASLRSSNIGDPRRGLHLLWERLDERYGSAERVEAALKTRLEAFPTISGKKLQGTLPVG